MQTPALVVRVMFAVLTASMPYSCDAGIALVDDSGQMVELKRPPERIVALAPHITELVFVAGAGDRLVGTVQSSDFPREARSIPRVGGYHALDYERILALQPDLVIVWGSGNGARVSERLRQLGLTLYVNEPRELADIAATIERFGQIAGTETVAQPAAANFRARLDALRQRYAAREPVMVFYQIWDLPLITANREQFISAAIRLCGGRNVFAALPSLAPRVSVEAVLRADPAAIVSGGSVDDNGTTLAHWQAWPQLQAVRNGHLFVVAADAMHRPTPRLLDAAERLCEQLETVRSSKSAAGVLD